MEISNNSSLASLVSPIKQQTGSGSDDDSDRKITIEINPSDDNVSSGDRSGNSASITVTTPNNEFSTDITRQEFFAGLAARNAKKTAGAIGNNGGSGINSQQSLFDTYMASANYANNMYSYGYSSSPYPNYGPSYGATGVNVYSQAMNSYIKQSLFFSAIA